MIPHSCKRIQAIQPWPFSPTVHADDEVGSQMEEVPYRTSRATESLFVRPPKLFQTGNPP